MAVRSKDNFPLEQKYETTAAKLITHNLCSLDAIINGFRHHVTQIFFDRHNMAAYFLETGIMPNVVKLSESQKSTVMHFIDLYLAARRPYRYENSALDKSIEKYLALPTK